MIDSALVAVVNELNEFLRLKFRLKGDRAVITNVVGQDGAPAIKDENKVLVSLINIEEEKRATPKHQDTGSNKPVYLYLYVLFSASFSANLNVEALKFISSVIAFFQSKTVFDPQNTNGLDPGIEKLMFEIYSLSFQEQSNMWASIGAKCMPAVLYKVRMIAINEALMKYEAPAVEGLDRNASASN
ncbi:MAG: hypothetical protein FD123_4096 [Bacteroidetes bacterium]|nr:MAG: hypothetical protein FD123_4096 [Bacteroidota bacterium]